MTTPSQDSAAEERPRRERREPEAPTAPIALGTREQALSDLLPEVFLGPDVEIGAVVDEVTLTVKPQNIPDVCRTAKEDPRMAMDYLRCLSVVDYEVRL